MALRLHCRSSMRVTLVMPVTGLIAGAVVGVWHPGLPTLVALAVATGGLLLGVHAWRVRQPPLLSAAVLVVCAAAGDLHAARAWQRAWRPSLRVAFEEMAHDARVTAVRAGRAVPEDNSAPVVLSGRLSTDAAASEAGTVSLALEVERIGPMASGGLERTADVNPVRGGVLLTVLGALGSERMQEWRAGRRIRAPAELRRPDRYLDPGVPDQERALARRGVTLVGTVKSAALVDLLNRGGLLDEAAGRLRAFTRRAVRDSVGRWSPRAAAIVMAIVIGDRTGLDDRIERRLQEAGTYHVIAISGGNIAILATLTLALFRIAGMLGRAAMLSSAVALMAYGFVVSGGASVSRAVLMAVIYFVARAWDLRGPPLQTLVLTAGVLLLADPLSVVDVGALLTFGATAGLVAAASTVPMDRVPARIAPGVALLVATAAAEAALLPVGAAVFSRVTFAGLVLNFAAIPLMAVAQLAGMTCIPLYALSVRLASAAGWVAYVGAEGLVRSADLVALAPWSTWRVGVPSPWAIVGYYACLLVAVRLCRERPPPSARKTPPLFDRRLRRLRLASIAGACALGLWMVAPPGLAASRGDGRLHVTFIDVGQGDAALLRLPQGAALLIDAGGLASGTAFDIGDRIVGPVMRHQQVGRLSTIVLTHGDADHIGGAPVVVREFRPWDVWDGVPVPPSTPMRLLREESLALGSRWTTVQRTDRVRFGEVEISVRHPPPADWERQDVRNDDSIVVELRWRDVSFVFTGDIGREVEEIVAAEFQPAPLRVLKVPHHGSLTSSSERFVQALAPAAAVISVGRSNSFGHPSPVVLQRYHDAGTAIFRTDQDGAVEVDSDGESLEITSYSGRRLLLGGGQPFHEDARGTKGTKPNKG